MLDTRKGVAQFLNHPLQKLRFLGGCELSQKLFGFLELGHSFLTFLSWVHVGWLELPQLRHMLILIPLNQHTNYLHKRRERMGLVFAHFVNELIQQVNEFVVLLFSVKHNRS